MKSESTRDPSRAADPSSKANRREVILDVAEDQFARLGFDGAAMREIARASGVDLALPNYHFGSKRGLFDAVLMRRAEILNEARLDALTACLAEAAPSAPSVESIVRAFLHPLLMRPEVHEQGWKNYFALIAYVNNSPEWGGKIMTHYFDPVIRKFISALRLALPTNDDRDIYWAYHCLSGALTLTFAQTGRIDSLSDGLCRSDDLTDAYEHMVRFVTAGFETFRKVE